MNLKTIPAYQQATGWLTREERDALFFYASKVCSVRGSETSILNIGVEYGASIVCLRAGCPAGHLVGVDIDLSKREPDIFDMAIWLKEDSRETVKRWTAPLDLVFIDGDHSEGGVENDLGFLPFVRTDGYVLFHDCYDWPPAPPKQVHQIFPGINEVVEDWTYEDTYDWEELGFVNTMRVFQRMD